MRSPARQRTTPPGPRHGAAKVALALALATLVAGGCGGESNRGSSKTRAAKPRAGGSDRGDFRVRFAEPRDEDEAAIRELLADPDGADLRGLAAGLSETFTLPHDITIEVGAGDPSPYFDPSTKAIHVQYAFVAYVDSVYRELYPDASDDEILGDDADLVDFVTMHELGHSIVDAYDIPVLGKEEDAVDALATVMMAEFVDGGSDIALSGADFFGALSGQQGTDFSESDFWDEHSLDRQRAYAIICWVAGSSESNFNRIAKADLIGQERLQSCPDEYSQKVESWFKLLEPHIKA